MQNSAGKAFVKQTRQKVRSKGQGASCLFLSSEYGIGGSCARLLGMPNRTIFLMCVSWQEEKNAAKADARFTEDELIQKLKGFPRMRSIQLSCLIWYSASPSSSTSLPKRPTLRLQVLLFSCKSFHRYAFSSRSLTSPVSTT